MKNFTSPLCLFLAAFCILIFSSTSTAAPTDADIQQILRKRIDTHHQSAWPIVRFAQALQLPPGIVTGGAPVATFIIIASFWSQVSYL